MDTELLMAALGSLMALAQFLNICLDIKVALRDAWINRRRIEQLLSSLSAALHVREMSTREFLEAFLRHKSEARPGGMLTRAVEAALEHCLSIIERLQEESVHDRQAEPCFVKVNLVWRSASEFQLGLARQSSRIVCGRMCDIIADARGIHDCLADQVPPLLERAFRAAAPKGAPSSTADQVSAQEPSYRPQVRRLVGRR